MVTDTGFGDLYSDMLGQRTITIVLDVLYYDRATDNELHVDVLICMFLVSPWGRQILLRNVPMFAFLFPQTAGSLALTQIGLLCGLRRAWIIMQLTGD